MNFSKFKKVADTDSHAIFRHDNGSELKVAKSGLSHGMRKQLDGLPIYAADGADIPTSLKADSSQDEVETGVPGININIHPPQDDSAEAYKADPQYQNLLSDYQKKVPAGSALENVSDPADVQAKRDYDKLQDYKKHPESFSQFQAGNAKGIDAIAEPPAAQGPVPDAAPASVPQGQDQQSPSPQLAQSAPQMARAPQAAAPVQPVDHKQVIHQQLSQEDQAWQHDLDNGHITPQTYQSLFEKKDTLGKIGTIFGLLLSGAGGGLSRQPNALLQMMNGQIQNDLTAQEQSKNNAQNFLRMNQQNQVNQAQIKNINSEAGVRAYTLANMQMNRAALHSLVMKAQQLPVGSAERMKADQTLAAMSQAVSNENFNLSDQAASNLARMKMMMGGDESNADPAAQIRQKQIMGFISPEQSKDALKELGAVQNHVQMNKNALDSFDKVAKLSTIGSHLSSPVQTGKLIDAEWNPMLDKLTKDTEGRVTPITVDMMNALKPSTTANTNTVKEFRNKMSGILNAGFATPTLDSLGVKVNKGELGGGQMVRVSDPSGRTGSIPASNLNKLPSGWTVIK